MVMGTAQRKLAWRLVGAVALAFVASLVLTWMLHEQLTWRDTKHLIDNVFSDVAVDIRERVDARMFRQAMVVRDKVYEMQEQPWWNDPDESSRRLLELAGELGVDEICIADAKGLLTHGARREQVGAIDFTRAEGQAREFAALLHDKYELSQTLLPDSLRGETGSYSHSEGYRGHYHIHLFHQELVLVLRTRLGIQTGVIGQRLDAVDNQQLRQIFHTLARQAIYNSTLARILLDELDNLLVKHQRLCRLRTHLIV